MLTLGINCTSLHPMFLPFGFCVVHNLPFIPGNNAGLNTGRVMLPIRTPLPSGNIGACLIVKLSQDEERRQDPGVFIGGHLDG